MTCCSCLAHTFINPNTQKPFTRCPDCAKKVKAYQKVYQVQKPWIRASINARSRAKIKKLDFDLTPQYLESIWKTHCPIRNVLMDPNGIKDNRPELDRINPLKGYVKGNVRVISHLANLWKSNLTIYELKLLLEDAIKLAKETPNTD